ncbi:F-box protein CPR1-like [Papaver somniferum]|uniref:F-box protein CPR1-like n=1 Tax=Papaver somniferum TaxID=3469 RepID=UPI000E702193|nr:F-box protein CPR1-like [Papaver somniferum]
MRDSMESGVLVNGDLHWLAERPQDSSYVLVSLDITKETFKELELPETLENNVLLINLGLLKGFLCLLEQSDSRVKIWVLQNYGVREFWTQRYVVKDEYGIVYRLILSFKGGDILFGNEFGLLL